MSEAAEVIEQEAPAEDMGDIHPSIADMLTGEQKDDLLPPEQGEDLTEPPAAEEQEKVEKVPEPTSEQVTLDSLQKQVAAFQRKAEDETRKRQDLQRQMQKPVEKADLFEDPDKRLSQEIGGATNAMLDRMVAMSEAQAKNRHDDYSAKEEFFMANMSDQAAAAYNSVDPGEFVYQAASKAMLAAELGNEGGLDALRDKIRAEVRLEQADEIKKQVEARLSDAAKIPGMAGDNTGKAVRSAAVPIDQPLDEILKR